MQIDLFESSNQASNMRIVDEGAELLELLISENSVISVFEPVNQVLITFISDTNLSIMDTS